MDEQGNLRTTENNSVTLARLEFLDDLLNVMQRLRFLLAPDQFIENDLVDAFLLALCGPRIADAHGIEFFRIHGTSDQELCSGQTQVAEATSLCFLANLFSDVQPRKG